MGQHVVRRGECISSVAFENGYAPGTVWNHPDNADLKRRRGDPNVLEPGDVIALPPKEPQSTMCATGKRHTFRRRGVPERLRVQLFHDDKPRAGAAYELIIDGKSVARGEADGDGLIDTWITPDARSGRILLRGGAEEIDLDLGTLAPLTTLLGVQTRLQNLGYYGGSLDGAASDDLDQAVVDFQADHGIEPTAEIDDATRDALRRAHTG
jgi:Putative peptidoglycan binding domain